tara:strand:- start:97 stop:723 length:627 start_codon:yes stop_codon:yes gene_type:complete
VSKIVNFTCLRIQAELDKYSRTKTIPHDLLDGLWTIDDIESCLEHMPKRYQRWGKKLIKEYTEFLDSNVDELKKALRKEYTAGMKAARTRDKHFSFPRVLNRYRPDINPIRALYYEARNLTRAYDSEDEYHQWLAELVTDKSFNNAMLDAMSHDIKRLERVIQRYYWPMLKLEEEQIPLELFHARQLIKDARHYYNFFLNLQNWHPDE